MKKVLMALARKARVESLVKMSVFLMFLALVCLVPLLVAVLMEAKLVRKVLKPALGARTVNFLAAQLPVASKAGKGSPVKAPLMKKVLMVPATRPSPVRMNGFLTSWVVACLLVSLLARSKVEVRKVLPEAKTVKVALAMA